MKNTIKIFVAFTINFSFLAGAFAEDLTFAHYHTQKQINDYMASEAQKHPKLVAYKNLGQSKQGREISYVVVSHGDFSKKPAIYFNGTHHGDEWSSTESILGLIDYLIAHETDAQVSTLLDTYAVYLQPLVNPDGHQAQTREDSVGRDPNRDYSDPSKAEAQSFKLPEIQLVKELLATIHPRAAAAYHSGIEEVLWSWCYTSNPTPDATLLSQITKVTAESMGFDRYLQSYDDYPTTGEFIDYAYMKYKTIALTFEVSNDKTPAEADLDGVVKRSLLGAMTFMYSVEAADHHSLQPSSIESQWGNLGNSNIHSLE